MRGQTRAMAEDKQSSFPGCLPPALASSLEKLESGGPGVDESTLGLCVGRQWGQTKVQVRGHVQRPGRGVLPTSPSWSQWPLLGVFWLSVECSGGNGRGRLKEAPLQARVPSSCGRRKQAFSCPTAWPWAAWLTAPGEGFVSQRPVFWVRCLV